MNRFAQTQGYLAGLRSEVDVDDEVVYELAEETSGRVKAVRVEPAAGKDDERVPLAEIASAQNLRDFGRREHVSA